MDDTVGLETLCGFGIPGEIGDGVETERGQRIQRESPSTGGFLGRYGPGTPPLGETPPVAPVPEGQKTMTVNREENQFSERTGDLALLPRTHRESAQSEGRPPRAR